MVNRVLVALDRRADLALVDRAVELARRHGAELHLVCGLPRPSFLTAFAPGMYAILQAELRDESRRIAAEAVAQVPLDVSVRWSHVHCRAQRSLVHLACRPGDVVVRQAAARPEASSQRVRGRFPHRVSRA